MFKYGSNFYERIMKVSALVLTRNRPEELFRCIESIRNQTIKPDEILILDNGSEKESSLINFEYLLKDCVIYSSDANLGCPGGRNFLIEKASGDFLLFVDDDGKLEINALMNGLNYFNIYKNLAVVTFRIIDDKTGKIRDGFSQNITPFLHHTFGGGSCLIKKDILKITGLYPTNFLRQGEEHDLAIRILDNGFKIIYAPDVILFHPLQKLSEETYYLSQISTITTAWRYMPYHYAILRTIINTFRLFNNNNLNPYEIFNLIKSSLQHRTPIKSNTYRNWFRLNRNVKKKFNSNEK